MASVKTKNSQPQPVVQKNIVLRQEQSLDGKPLDFSFKQLKSLEDLKNCDPRSGKRKEPPKDEEENKEETKKIEAEEDQEQKQNENDEISQKEDNAEKQDGQENVQGTQKVKEKKEEKKPENKQPQIIRVIPTNTAQTLVTSNQIQMGGQAKGVGVQGYGEDGKGNSQKFVVKINLVCSSLILGYNKIRSLQNFRQCIDYVMLGNWKENLCWIDLSHNYLENLDYNFSDVPNLKSLYLHCNYLSDINQLCQLQELPLRTLTIHGNPVETINNFRLYIIGILPALKRLDSVLISKKEKDNCSVWINMFRHRQPPVVADPNKPPQENQLQHAQKQ